MNTLDDYLDDDEQQQREFIDRGDYNPNDNNEYYDNNNDNENGNEMNNQMNDLWFI